jgi:hypothetical protein
MRFFEFRAVSNLLWVLDVSFPIVGVLALVNFNLLATVIIA